MIYWLMLRDPYSSCKSVKETGKTWLLIDKIFWVQCFDRVSEYRSNFLIYKLCVSITYNITDNITDIGILGTRFLGIFVMILDITPLIQSFLQQDYDVPLQQFWVVWYSFFSRTRSHIGIYMRIVGHLIIGLIEALDPRHLNLL